MTFWDRNANFFAAVIGLITPILFFLMFFSLLSEQTQSAEGTTANASFGRSLTGFRFYGNAKGRVGSLVTPLMPPLKKRSVRNLLALPKGNMATCLTIVTIPKEQKVQIREVVPKNGRRGGWLELELKKSELKKGWFSAGMRTPWAPNPPKSPKC